MWIRITSPVNMALDQIFGEGYEVKVDESSADGGLSGANLQRIQVLNKSNDVVRYYILKTVRNSLLVRSAELGLPREGLFYQHFADRLREADVLLPNVIHSYGDMNTGQKTIILEDLSDECIQAGYFFGPGSPLNWGKDLNSYISKANTNQESVTLETVAHEAFILAARLHARFWQDYSLLEIPWFRSSAWFKSQDENSWRDAQAVASSYWANTKQVISDNLSSVQWDSNLICCMDASISKISWSSYQESSRNRPWTLVHGDYHPANMMWDCNKRRIVLLDFEVVGLGSGPQDLGQFMISHVNPEIRKEIEERLVRSYYQELISKGDRNLLDEEKYSWENCWRDYKFGGCERWVWLLALLTGLCPENMVQYFQDQLAAFMIDHEITPENICMPRV
jgi:hypothetical protein